MINISHRWVRHDIPLETLVLLAHAILSRTEHERAHFAYSKLEVVVNAYIYEDLTGCILWKSKPLFDESIG